MTADTVSPPTPHVPVQIEWAGGLQFDAGRPDGPKARIDELSVTKYCSVGSSLRADAPLSWAIEIKT
jgi:hypothetical protein